MIINENIKRLRIENNMSQEQLAEAMDVTRQSVSKWETGKANPDTDKLIGLASIFNVPITALTGTDTADDNIPASNSPEKKNFWKIAAIVESIIILSFVIFVVFLVNRYQPSFWHNLLSSNNVDYISVSLEHNNIFEDGIDGVLKDITDKIDFPEYLMLSSDFDLNFTPDGTITSIDTLWYGYDERYSFVDSYLITYDCSKSASIKIYTGSGTEDAYNADKDVVTLLDALRVIDLKSTVSKWNEPEYAILYKGIRSWGYNSEGIVYIDSNGQTDIPSDTLSEEISGPSVSVYCPNNNDIVPVRYIYCKDVTQEENIK